MADWNAVDLNSILTFWQCEIYTGTRQLACLALPQQGTDLTSSRTSGVASAGGGADAADAGAGGCASVVAAAGVAAATGGGRTGSGSGRRSTGAGAVAAGVALRDDRKAGLKDAGAFVFNAAAATVSSPFRIVSGVLSQ